MTDFNDMPKGTDDTEENSSIKKSSSKNIKSTSTHINSVVTTASSHGHHHLHTKDEIPLSLAKALATGIIASVIFTAIGMITYLVVNYKSLSKGSYHKLDRQLLVKSIDPHLFIHNLFNLNALGILGLGLYFLILTPFLRVVASVYQFARVKDHAFTIITATVALLLIFGFILGMLNASIKF
jgi:uncharacterized membrane protein